MKAQSYFVRANEENHGIVVVRNGEKEIEIADIGDLSTMSAQQVDERAKLELKLKDIEIGEMEEIYFQDQKIDLSLVRTKMRSILKDLSNEDLSLNEKKQKLDIYQQMCSSAQIIVNTCKLELAIEQSTKRKK